MADNKTSDPDGLISVDFHSLHHTLGRSHQPGETAAVQDTLSTTNRMQQHPDSVPALKEGTNPSTSTRPPPNNKSVSLIFLKGLFQLASLQIVAPFERVYLLMQCRNEMTKSGRLSRPYNGIRDCFVRTIKTDGVTSLWRAGNNVHAIKFLTLQAFSLPNYKGLRDMTGYDKMIKYDFESNYRKSCYLLFFTNDVPASFLGYPLDYARTRLATDVRSPRAVQFSLDPNMNRFRNKIGCDRQFNGVTDVWLKTLKSDGVRGLYRGYTLRLLEMTLAKGILTEINATLLEKAKERKQKQKQKQKQYYYLGKALHFSIVTSIYVACYPLRTVSTRMMMTSSGEADKYKGVTDAFRQIVRHEGFFSLYKGVLPCVIHSGLTTATFLFLSSGALALLKRFT